LVPDSERSTRNLGKEAVERKEDSNNDEASFFPIDPYFEQEVIHPNWTHKQMPPANRTGPGDDTIMLLGIFSTMLEPKKEAEKRQMIRDTYLSYNNDSRVCSLQDYMRLTKKGSANNCKVLYTFVIGGLEGGPTDHYHSKAPLTINPVKFKNTSEDDVTYLNIKENLHEGKSTTWLKYCASVSRVYGIDYSAKVDQDTMLNMPHLVDFIITDLPPYPYNVRIFGGNFICNPSLKSRGLMYPSGQFYYLSSDMAEFVSSDEIDRKENRKFKGRVYPDILPVGKNADVDIGKYVFSHPYPVKFVQMSHRVLYTHRIKGVQEWMKLWKEVEGLPPVTRAIGYNWPESKLKAYIGRKAMSRDNEIKA